MDNSELRLKVFEEVKQIPDEHLRELYDLIHSFRLGSASTNADADSIMNFAGCWGDLPAQTYIELAEELNLRRHQAFSQRRNRETSFD
jgi:hypothetical protein